MSNFSQFRGAEIIILNKFSSLRGSYKKHTRISVSYILYTSMGNSSGSIATVVVQRLAHEIRGQIIFHFASAVILRLRLIIFNFALFIVLIYKDFREVENNQAQTQNQLKAYALRGIDI
ncbi:hypothetical protein BDC45DRAFT_559103 [Circinella umbellata]|nr:hypothetical protein BDC45DRAFT_559103 [Circinella umbellata]